MAIGTLQVGVTTTPAVLTAFFSHYAHKLSRKKKAKETGVSDPAVDLVYDEGIKVMRAFLSFAAKHTLEDIQGFTAMFVPCPVYVRKDTVTIPYKACIDKAEEILEKQLDSYGPKSFERIGGRKWWRVRGKELEGEWIEMKRDYVNRHATLATESLERRQKEERVILYIHGGAYFFSSLDTHRYQIQRHARKLGGRAFAPAYRLAPQYPFPCGILDTLAAYLYLIDPPPGSTHDPILPSSIILAGDSAGGGAVLALLVTIRDQGLPMPAGADLFSPWVDLCHSFPSVVENHDTDYIPGNGFHFRPSLAWPPVKEDPLVIKSDREGEEPVTIEEQIQLYTSNSLLTHPLVSPINHGSLGGLCPLLIQTGGGELLRDEQIYLAHKAANPIRYPPGASVLADYPNQAELVDKFRPTNVQLQVFDNCAHVIPTLSITAPAKYMYRSAANFNIWAIVSAKKKLEAKKSRSQSSSRKKGSTTISDGAASGSECHHHHSHHNHHGHHNNGTSHNASQAGSSGVSSVAPSRTSSFLGIDTTMLNGKFGPLRSTSPISMENSPISVETTQTQAHNLHLQVNREKLREADLQSELTDSSFDSSSCSSIAPEDVWREAEARHAGPGQSLDAKSKGTLSERIIVSGSLPPFGLGHIIRQRASCHGRLRQMEPEEEIKALNLPPDYVGRVHIDGPVSYWIETRIKAETKYAKDLHKYRKIKAEDYAVAKEQGFLTRDLQGENPPQCALASWHDLKLAREVGKSVDETSGKSNAAVGLYMKISQRADAQHAGDVTDASSDAIERTRTRQSQHNNAAS